MVGFDDCRLYKIAQSIVHKYGSNFYPASLDDIFCSRGCPFEEVAHVFKSITLGDLKYIPIEHFRESVKITNANPKTRTDQKEHASLAQLRVVAQICVGQMYAVYNICISISSNTQYANEPSYQ